AGPTEPGARLARSTPEGREAAHDRRERSQRGFAVKISCGSPPSCVSRGVPLGLARRAAVLFLLGASAPVLASSPSASGTIEVGEDRPVAARYDAAHPRRTNSPAGPLSVEEVLHAPTLAPYSPPAFSPDK